MTHVLRTTLYEITSKSNYQNVINYNVFITNKTDLSESIQPKHLSRIFSVIGVALDSWRREVEMVTHMQYQDLTLHTLTLRIDHGFRV